MALDLTTEQKEIGQRNFREASDGLSRRGFLRGLAIAGGVAAVSPAVYFGWQSLNGRPVKVALIGTGDEGGVLAGAHNPAYTEMVAVCDIRPSNRRRIYEGDTGGARAVRPGLKAIYGNDAERRIRFYTDYRELLRNPDIEAVIIALPLHIHAQVAIDAMRAGKHVLCEKLMAWNIRQCKDMIRTARETNRVLSIGHQRHYSLLYAHAAEMINAGVLGDIKHIRALWHRNNTWPSAGRAANWADGVTQPQLRDGWFPPITKEDADALAGTLSNYVGDYRSIEELVRWRIYQRTGGGLMAELGSHQLDACSIFLGKVQPLAVTGVGGKMFYNPRRGNDRDEECYDHVFATYEFPGKGYYERDNNGAIVMRNGQPVVADRHDLVVVTYSSINTNSFEQYGECVMGTRGTMIVEAESSVMLYPEKNPANPVAGNVRNLAVTVGGSANAPTMDAASTWGPPTAGAGAAAAGPASTVGGSGGTVSRGYREEMEDFAYCIRLWDERIGYQKDSAGRYIQRLPRCHGEVAMADAIVALTANHAMKHHQRIEFLRSWFDADAAEVPDRD